MDLQPYGRGMMIMGLILVAVGTVFWLSPRVPWIGRLPGDMLLQRDGMTFYFPLTSSVLVSLLLSAILWVAGRMK